ncbi:MAG: PAS domain-containing protein, partial [Betaproteobacteria bacterium]|nr:PAS domain-containing protein [Betaproteobacteria bacterium]
MSSTPRHGADPLGPILDAIRPGLAMLGFPAYVIDAGERYRFVNEAYEVHFARKASELVGRSVTEIYGPPPPDGRREPLLKALAGETLTFDRESRHGPRKGQWSRLHYMPIREGGAVLGVCVVLVSIQHLKDAQEAIAARERQLALITDTIGFPVTYFDRDRVVRFANAKSAEWAGRTPEGMLGLQLHELTPPEVTPLVRPLLDRALAGEAVTYEREALWPGREKRRVRGHMIPDRDESGAVRGALVVLLDIEDDYRLQESLLARTRELQIVMENVGVPMSYIGMDESFRFANAPGLDWLPGVTLDNVVGKRLDEVYPPQVIAGIRVHLDRALRGERVVYERQGLDREGKLRWARVTLIPDKVGGELHGVFSVVIDIDDDKRLREALERQERQLRFYAENIPEAIAFVGPDFRYEFINKTFERI